MTSKDRYLRYQGAANRDRASDEAHRAFTNCQALRPTGLVGTGNDSGKNHGPDSLVSEAGVGRAGGRCGRWRQIQEELSVLNHVRVPRWMRTGISTNQMEIHGFADASERAYAAVYLRTIEERKVRTSLVVAKSRIAPVHPMSLPRLELFAAALLTRLVRHVQSVTGLTDTRVVLVGFHRGTGVDPWPSVKMEDFRDKLGGTDSVRTPRCTVAASSRQGQPGRLCVERHRPGGTLEARPLVAGTAMADGQSPGASKGALGPSGPAGAAYPGAWCRH